MEKKKKLQRAGNVKETAKTKERIIRNNWHKEKMNT
jgi:hypothetical protein